MKASRFYLILGGLTLAVSLVGQMALAGEPSKQKPGKSSAAEPTKADVDKSGERGIVITTQTTVGAAAANAVPIVPVVKQPVPTKSTVVNHHANVGKKPPKQVKTAINTKAVKSPIKNPAPSPESGSTQSGMQSDVQMVSHQTSGVMELRAWLNKSGNNPVYKVGEKMVINVQPSQDCNLMVFDFDGKSSLKQLFPNEYQPSGAVKAGDTISIGGADSQFDYQVGGSGGAERIFVYAYPTNTTSSPLTVALAPTAHSPFRSGEMTLEQYRHLVNGSKVYFRDVKIVPKAGAKPVVDTTGTAPNKVELNFNVK